MKIAHIAPRKHLELADEGDFDFVLAHVALKYKRYKKFFSNRGDREVYLDNGVWETGEPLDAKTMIDLAIEMQPTYVFAPDYINDAASTIRSVQTFCNATARYPEFSAKIVATSQGSTRDVWYSCVKRLSEIGSVDVIAVPRHPVRDMFEYERNLAVRMTKTRLEFCRVLDKEVEKLNGKKFYATGAGASVCVRELAKQFPWFIGIDTTMACLLGSASIRITGRFETYKPKGKLDFDAEYTPDQLDDIIFNIDVLNRWAHGEGQDE